MRPVGDINTRATLASSSLASLVWAWQCAERIAQCHVAASHAVRQQQQQRAQRAPCVHLVHAAAHDPAAALT